MTDRRSPQEPVALLLAGIGLTDAVEAAPVPAAAAPAAAAVTAVPSHL
ncbi:MAG: hypothetical protein JWQ92_210, partial [Amnibacterium sp.]|nr:hypothetical protein [Amnibacterium sp.]